MPKKIEIQTGEFLFHTVKTWITCLDLVEWMYRDDAGVLHRGLAPSWQEAVEEARRFGFSL